MIEWDEDSMTIGNAGMGKIIITDDEIKVEMSAIALTTTAISTIALMTLLQ